MNTLIVYDTVYGNTKKVAQLLSNKFDQSTTAAIPVAKIALVDIAHVDLLIVGSPVHGGRPTSAISTWLKTLPEQSLSGKKVAAFDTRGKISDQPFLLKLLINVIGYAAPKIAEVLIQKGGTLILPPEGFFVNGKEGPLKETELERICFWASEVSRSCQ